jgi:phosphonate transport system ATP-binding protein
MDRSSGELKLFSKVIQAADKKAACCRSALRDVSIIFQQFNLVGRLPLLTNVLVGRLAHNPAWKGMIKFFPKKERIKALEALERVNMVDFAHQRASTMSGGQQHRPSSDPGSQAYPGRRTDRFLGSCLFRSGYEPALRHQ